MGSQNTPSGSEGPAAHSCLFYLASRPAQDLWQRAGQVKKVHMIQLALMLSHQPKFFLDHVSYRYKSLQLFQLLYSSTTILLCLLLALNEVRVILQFPDVGLRKLRKSKSCCFCLLCQGIRQIPISRDPNQLGVGLAQLPLQLIALQGTSSI